jgi:membrane protease YdiL (CAAX protease family)
LEKINVNEWTIIVVLLNGLVFAISHWDNNKPMFFFRTIFGSYSFYIFKLTGNFWCSAFLHIHCNFLGPPLPAKPNHDEKTKKNLKTVLYLGIGSFFLLLTIFSIKM